MIMRITTDQTIETSTYVLPRLAENIISFTYVIKIIGQLSLQIMVLTPSLHMSFCCCQIQRIFRKRINAHMLWI